MHPITLFWFRRDLRLEDNHGLFQALQSDNQVQCIFIFDKKILQDLKEDDKLTLDSRLIFIHRTIQVLKDKLTSLGSDLWVYYDEPINVFRHLIDKYKVKALYFNHDYEPYAIRRDADIQSLFLAYSIPSFSHKDQCIFEKNEVLKDDGSPYTIFTPYSKKWRARLELSSVSTFSSECLMQNFNKSPSCTDMISLIELGFNEANMIFPSANVPAEVIKDYDRFRDFPALEGTSRLGVHLRFGTFSIRKLLLFATHHTANTFVNELIWRDFYMMILFHFPYVVHGSFKREYDNIIWNNDEDQFRLWCEGRTGFPLVDAGMRELNGSGFMHNRVRMITASFLVKDLLIDWRWGEAYFAQKLLDYELSSNNGGWQWAASCGCDAAPYFRIFNPDLQAKKFDPLGAYIRKWIPEFGTAEYPLPIVNHQEAKEKSLKVFSDALKK